MDHFANPKHIGTYSVLEQIGKGATGSVYKCINQSCLRTVAIKNIKMDPHQSQISGNDRKRICVFNEKYLLERINHPNILSLIDFIENDTSINLVLEYMEMGSVENLVKRLGKVSEDFAKQMVRQLLVGLSYLHSNGIVHRDVKGANILLDKNGVIKLSDFGIAKQMKNFSVIHQPPSSFVGTPYWMSPEMILNSEKNVFPANDIWSVGCTVIECLSGNPPYHDLNHMSAFYCIVQDEHPVIPDSFSADCKDFLLQCFQKQPDERPSATSLLEHKWLKSLTLVGPETSMISVTIPGTDDVVAGIQQSESSNHKNNQELSKILRSKGKLRKGSGNSHKKFLQKYEGVDIESFETQPLGSRIGRLLPNESQDKLNNEYESQISQKIINQRIQKVASDRLIHVSKRNNPASEDYFGKFELRRKNTEIDDNRDDLQGIPPVGKGHRHPFVNLNKMTPSGNSKGKRYSMSIAESSSDFRTVVQRLYYSRVFLSKDLSSFYNKFVKKESDMSILMESDLTFIFDFKRFNQTQLSDLTYILVKICRKLLLDHGVENIFRLIPAHCLISVLKKAIRICLKQTKLSSKILEILHILISHESSEFCADKILHLLISMIDVEVIEASLDQTRSTVIETAAFSLELIERSLDDHFCYFTLNNLLKNQLFYKLLIWLNMSSDQKAKQKIDILAINLLQLIAQKVVGNAEGQPFNWYQSIFCDQIFFEVK